MVIYPSVDNSRVFTTVQFHQPRDQVNLEKEMDLIFKRDQIVGVGSLFAIQFLTSDKSAVLSSAMFIVTEEKEERVTSDANPYQPVSRDIKLRKFRQIGPWEFFDVEDAAEPLQPRKQPPPEKTQPKVAKRRTA